MKAFDMTPAQQAEYNVLKSNLTAAQAPVRAASQALRGFVATVVNDPTVTSRPFRADVTEDGETLIVV
jgi:hypothetical protein